MRKTIINAPQLGVNDLFGTIVDWTVTDGQEIEIGEIICSIETTKATIDIKSDVHGIVKLLVTEGDEVEINQPICIVYSTLDDFNVFSETDFNSLQKSKIDEMLLITKKAQKLIDKYSININKYIKAGIVKEKDIIELVETLEANSYEINFIKGKKNILIYGASQGGYTAIEALKLNDSNNEIIGFIDDDVKKQNKKLYEIPVFSSSQINACGFKKKLYVFIAIAKHIIRKKKTSWAEDNQLVLITVKHPNSFVSPSAVIGKGCHIKSGAVIDSNTIIEEGCIIDNNTTIAHDNHVGKFCHLAPGVVLGSNINIGDNSIIGIGSSISTNITIGKNNIISVGSAVTINTPPNSILEGTPAKIIGKTK